MDDSDSTDRSVSRRRLLAATGAATAGVLAGTGSTLAAETSTSSSGTPEVHMHPTVFSPFVKELAENPGQWGWVLDHLDGLGAHEHYFYPRPGWVDPTEVPGYNRDHLKKLTALTNEHRLDLSMEVAGPDPTHRPFDANIGDRAAEETVKRIRSIEDVGGTVDHLNIDGPIRRQLKGVGQIPSEENYGFDTVDRCIEETLKFAESVWLRAPSVSFYVIPNFPNWGWKGGGSLTSENWGDYYDVVRPLIDAFDRSRVPFEGIMVDNPYNYGGFDRLADLERVVENRGYEFNLILNDEAGNVSGDAFARETREYLGEVQRRGLSPGRYTVESWYQYPKRQVPETDSSTMTGLTKDVIEGVTGGGSKPSPGKGRPVPLYRLFNSRRIDHRYTIDDGEKRAAERAGYNAEGVAATVFDGPRAGTVPLYELYLPWIQDHFYTTSDRGRRTVKEWGAEDRGVAAHVHPSGGSGTKPFFRLFSPEHGNHFYTVSRRERNVVEDRLPYRFESVQCHVR